MQDHAKAQQGFHLMAKPIGPLCNLDCGYCFYLEKEQLFPPRERFRMSDEVLRAYITSYVAAQTTPVVEFTWQGGEPTLLGLEFFERAVSLQREIGSDKTIRNTLQTNGTLLDDAWCAFLAREGFTVGISLDGPREVHDLYRQDKRGRPSFDDTLRGLRLLLQHGVAVNVLVTVAREVAKYPLEIYRFLKAEGVRYIQFNAVVERAPREQEIRFGLTFATPPALSRPGRAETDLASAVTTHSVEPEAYGDFLIAVFDEWVRQDVGNVHVMNFEWALAAWCELPASVCLFAPRCGKAAIVEHDGSMYACDHFVYPEYKLGNIRTDDAAAMIASPAQTAFGEAKESTLPQYCRQCSYRFACHGECPKNRFIATPDGEAGLNYLCAGYKKYFRHITQYMNAMAKLLSHGQPAELIMQAFKGPLLVKLARHRT
ncbi:Anaerobic sulfatase-maturating enzyme [Paraburkholderia nemoris]|uniref:anaerobic sulfatase maturase n=1 Tax=Paraburkholderia nemoris TaxID=2793076 RepID=UPI001B2E19D4|nr:MULTISPECIES: anaerobic sulfatase maturase [Paraburkholderia]MBK3786321.1 anaerobic sulfatase maturase [Paraburkholderia aspalathi]CAE6851443.1 Anaerobic sulfatase-maturating enzyme [Paraburkholderia nemoris]